MATQGSSNYINHKIEGPTLRLDFDMRNQYYVNAEEKYLISLCILKTQRKFISNLRKNYSFYETKFYSLHKANGDMDIES